MDYRNKDRKDTNSNDGSKKEGLYDTAQIRAALNESFDLSRITVSESLIQMTLQKASMQKQNLNMQNASGESMSLPLEGINQRQEHSTGKRKTNFYQIGLAAACVGLLLIGGIALKEQGFDFSIGSNKKDSASMDSATETADSEAYDSSTDTSDIASIDGSAEDNSLASEEVLGEDPRSESETDATDGATGTKDSSQATTADNTQKSTGSDMFRFATLSGELTISAEQIAEVNIYDSEDALLQEMMKEEDIVMFYQRLGALEMDSASSVDLEQYQRHYVITAKDNQTWKELQIWAKESIHCQVTTESGEIIDNVFTPTNQLDLDYMLNHY